MSLEDHLGDIVRKARTMSKVSTAAAARAARVSEAELGRLEATGQTSASPDYRPLAELIGLDAAKLSRLAQGWEPAKVDLGQWREFRVLTTEAEGMAVNCYLAWDEVTREAALFDTGWFADPVLELVRQSSLRLAHIFVTHSHDDHIAALDAIKSACPKARIHTSAAGAPVDRRNRANECVQLGSLRITHRDTPGHADDGTTYLVGNWPEDAPHVAIVGDAIFAGSMGRGNPDWTLARRKVREQILSLPPGTLLCPGHGPLTTVAQEKEFNPFF